eukprot:TRINITY_DN61867_c0_g1_i1.p1 TRINITY_DN61867_c0_g1~~TRINITY_DN61867_c0_g1_i1.p1  ORF type:complete len:186 (-),score=16.68 TRINITY_DN61867_c0_g1_i1:137-694(-)
MCYDDFDYGVMLRDPLSLMTSQINNHKDHSTCDESKWEVAYGHGPPTECREHFISILRDRISNTSEDDGSDFPGISLFKLFDNFQTRVLASAIHVPLGHISDEHVAQAKERLSKFKMVLPLEQLEARKDELFAALDWDPTISLFHRHVNDDEEPFSAEDAKWLKTHNKHDSALVEFFKTSRSKQH